MNGYGEFNSDSEVTRDLIKTGKFTKKDRVVLSSVVKLVEGGTDQWRYMVFGVCDKNEVLRHSLDEVIYKLVLGQVGTEERAKGVISFCSPFQIMYNLCKAYDVDFSSICVNAGLKRIK